MAFFKFRLPGQTSSSSASEAVNASPAESLEVLRKRARHRLMGSVVLVLAAVIGFPLLFDTQPRPVAVDTPIVIPERTTSASTSPAVTAPVTAVSGAVKPLPSVTTASGTLPSASVLDENEEVVPAAERAVEKPPRAVESVAATPTPGGFKVDFGKTGAPAPAVLESRPEIKPDLKPESKAPTVAKTVAEPKAEHKVERKSESASPSAADKARDDAAKARALLEGKAAVKTSDERLVIQVGAYSDAAKMREARQKLEAAGFKTYTQVIDSKDGKRTRVRVGPFANKDEAEKSAQKIRKLHLETSILKL